MRIRDNLWHTKGASIGLQKILQEIESLKHIKAQGL
jgi:5-bromo-4-chloroindolyl phosphate hydrolysis protein